MSDLFMNKSSDDWNKLKHLVDLSAENARLKAEVDALKLGSLLTAVDVLQFIKLKEENERLTEIIRREVDGGVDLREEAQRTVEENHGLRAEVAQLTSERDGLWESNEGNLKEVSRLKAEVERLTQNTDKLCKHGDLEIARLKAEVESLKQAWVDKKMQQDRDTLLQQVERLRKAGDAMAHWVGEDTHFWWGQPEAAVEAWNAAKEGKQP